MLACNVEYKVVYNIINELKTIGGGHVMRIYTIGHFDYSLDKFLEMLQTAGITLVTDVRSFPNSKKHPQYNQQSFQEWLENNKIKYFHNILLGGRRKQSSIVGVTLNEGWDNQSFHNYADYTLTDEFKEGIQSLMEEAKENTVAILCAERHPSRCHRLIISNWLAAHDVNVDHIIVNNKEKIEIVQHELGQWGAMPIIEDDGEIVYPKNTTSKND